MSSFMSLGVLENFERLENTHIAMPSCVFEEIGGLESG